MGNSLAMNPYNVGTLILFEDRFIDELFIGIIIDYSYQRDWQGGGYYIVQWNKYFGPKELSFSLLNHWVKRAEATVYPVQK